MSDQPGGYTGGQLLVAFGGGVALGVSLCYMMAQRALSRAGPARGGRRSPIPALNLGFLGRSSTSGETTSGFSTPAETPRTGSSENLEALGGPDIRMAVLVRQDLPMAAGKIVQHTAWTVLGMFKKLWKRKDPLLRDWDVRGERLDVLLAPSEDAMMAVQAQARQLGVPTHTFAGRDRSRKQRTVMAVGPADAATLQHVTGHLREL